MRRAVLAISLAAAAPAVADAIHFTHLSPPNPNCEAIAIYPAAGPASIVVGGNGNTSSYLPDNLAAGNQGTPFSFGANASDYETVGNDLYNINSSGLISLRLSPNTQGATLDEAFALAYLYSYTEGGHTYIMFAAFGDYQNQSTMVIVDFNSGQQTSRTLPYYVFGACGLGDVDSNGHVHVLVTDADGRVRQVDLGPQAGSVPVVVHEWNVVGLANLEDVAYDGVRLFAIDPERVGSALFTPVTRCVPCPADFDDNGGVDGGDLAAFFADFEAGAECADVDRNGGIDGGDLATFFIVFEAGGC